MFNIPNHIVEISADGLAKNTQAIKDSYEQHCQKNGETPKEFIRHCLDVHYERIKDKPIRYRAYGVYWWALKALFIKYGYDFGVAGWDYVDNDYAEQYKGASDEQTCVLADMFWESYYSSHIVGSNQFWVNFTQYTLMDKSMEVLI